MKSRTPTTVTTFGLLLGGGALALSACGSGTSGSTAATTGGSSAAASGSIVSTTSVDGMQTLADTTGHTLYSASAEAGGHILCVASCTDFWKPVTASQRQAQQASTALGMTFGTVQRPDGSRQLTYGGLPLYSFTSEGMHELRGNGFSDDFGGTQFTWAAALSTGAASTPAGFGTGSGRGGGYGY